MKDGALIMSKKNNIGTVFLRRDNNTSKFISKMETLSTKSTGQLKRDIETQIRFAKYGKVGEDNIAYELTNSGIDMYVLQDLYFEHDGLSAQIDYMVFTRNSTYIIESKNLMGNVSIDKDGNFIRTYEFNGKKTKEGIYSPITQNERHKLIVKNMFAEGRNFIQMKIFNKFFDEGHKTLVVLANPKTILEDNRCQKTLTSEILRADSLIKYIRENDSKRELDMNNDEMLKKANFFLNRNIEERKDYSLKYEELLKEQLSSKTATKKIFKPTKPTESVKPTEKSKVCPRCGSGLVLRTAKRGDNKGNQFYGCGSYPKCRFTEKI